MPEKKKKEKKDGFVVNTTGHCPYCKHSLLVKVKREVIIKGTPSQTRMETFIDKDDQKKLTDLRK